MNKKKVLLGSCGVIFCLVGGSLLAANHFVDRQVILQQLYNNIEKQTGRKLALHNLEIHFFPWPEIQASKITLSNIQNGKNPNFITADYLKANLNLWSLWQKKIHFKSIHLSNVKIHLERNEQGQKNWDFQPMEITPNPSQQKKKKSTHFKWKWQFNSIQLENVECWYDDALTHKNIHLLFQQAELNQLETNKVKFNINGSHHHADFTISGRVSNFNDLLESDNTTSTSAKFQVNLTEYVRKQNIGNIRVSGNLKSIVKAKGYDITLRGTILNLNDLNHLFPHANLPSVENITLSAAIKDVAQDSDPQAKPQIDLFQLHTGQINTPFLPTDLYLITTEIIANDLNSNVNTQVTGQLYGVMFRWSGHLGDFKQLQDILLYRTDKSIFVSGNLSSENYNAKLDGNIGGKSPILSVKLNLLNYNRYFKDLGNLNAQNLMYTGKVFTPFPINLSFFKNITKEKLFDIATTGNLKSNNIAINQIHFDNFSTDIEWKNKDLLLTQLQLINKQENIKGDLIYSIKQELPTLIVKIKNSLFPMKWVEDYFNIANVYSGQITVIGNLYTKGNNLQEWQHNLIGKLGMFGINGQLNAEGLKHYIGQAASTLPLKKSLSTQCLAIRTQINEKDLYFDTLTLQTDQFALNGQGKFYIPDQKLDLHFIPDISLGVINASAPLRIGGTLSKPYATFDKNKDKVFSLNINTLNKNAAPTNYCKNALEKSRNPLGISQK